MVGVTVSVVTCVCVLQLFNSILLTLPRLTTSSGGRSPADAVLDLAGDIIGKLPVNYNMEAVCVLYTLFISIITRLTYFWFVFQCVFSVYAISFNFMHTRYAGKTGRASSASWSNKFVSCDILLQISASVTRKLSVLDSDKQDFVGRDGSLMKCCYILYKLMYTLGRLVCRWQHHCVFHYFEFSLITWDKFWTDWSLGPKLIGTHSLILHWQNSLNC